MSEEPACGRPTPRWSVVSWLGATAILLTRVLAAPGSRVLVGPPLSASAPKANPANGSTPPGPNPQPTLASASVETLKAGLVAGRQQSGPSPSVLVPITVDTLVHESNMATPPPP